MLRDISRRNPYRAQWDEYLSRWDPTEIGDGSLPKGSWPGDEWGTRGNWDKVFRTMFLNFDAHSWRHCVEIGAIHQAFALTHCCGYYCLRYQPTLSRCIDSTLGVGGQG